MSAVQMAQHRSLFVAKKNMIEIKGTKGERFLFFLCVLFTLWHDVTGLGRLVSSHWCHANVRPFRSSKIDERDLANIWVVHYTWTPITLREREEKERPSTAEVVEPMKWTHSVLFYPSESTSAVRESWKLNLTKGRLLALLPSLSPPPTTSLPTVQ